MNAGRHADSRTISRQATVIAPASPGVPGSIWASSFRAAIRPIFPRSMSIVVNGSGAQVLQWTDNGTPDRLWTLTAS